ncbi:MAG TPA: pirin family protein [Nitrospiraceae bacterium]|nr:pirin family protein [Nitrospiraceae bacterium]
MKDMIETVDVKKAEQVKVYQPGSQHVVGDGFHVRNLFPSNDLDRELSPFIMLDYAGPTFYPATDTPRGVGEHPHRGFETVTIVYQGIVAHRDSAGNSGVIGPGDVQWMTAASGIVHEELHEKEWAKHGGTLQAIQLWVNLPRSSKMSAPGYQTIVNEQIPVVQLDGGSGSLRVIAGSVGSAKGPAKTFTPIELYDLRLRAGHSVPLQIPNGYNVGLLVLSGQASVEGSRQLSEAELAVFVSTGEPVKIVAEEDATILVMAGEGIDEPVARYGPFVMNTKAELVQAVNDYQAGKMGHLA